VSAKLFEILLRKGASKRFVQLLQDWYQKCCVYVRWDGVYSDPFPVTSGLRQGSILSPLLFSVYIDILVAELSKSQSGCYVHGIFLGCILYADDIVLLSLSIRSLQHMLDISIAAIHNLDLRFNVSKSACCRFGPRYRILCDVLLLGSERLKYVSNICYLGVNLEAGKNFNRSISESKLKFYKVFNMMYNKCACTLPENVSLELLRSKCIPILYYACGAFPMSKSDNRSLDRILYRALAKIFKTYDSDIISAVKLNFGIKDSANYAIARHKKFHDKFSIKNFSFKQVILSIAEDC